MNGEEMFSFDKLFPPINVSECHWDLVLVLMKNKQIKYYDSKKYCGKNNVNKVFKYMQDKHVNMKGSALTNINNWTLTKEKNIPQQGDNGTEFSVHLCINLDLLAQDLHLDYDPSITIKYRERITWLILEEEHSITSIQLLPNIPDSPSRSIPTENNTSDHNQNDPIPITTDNEIKPDPKYSNIATALLAISKYILDQKLPGMKLLKMCSDKDLKEYSKKKLIHGLENKN